MIKEKERDILFAPTTNTFWKQEKKKTCPITGMSNDWNQIHSNFFYILPKILIFRNLKTLSYSINM